MWKFKITIALLYAFLLEIGCSSTDNKLPEWHTGKISTNAMLAAANPLAAKVGLSILKEGGNAFDAAVAVQFALAVVHPRAGNIGGGGFAVYRLNNGQVGCLDFRETAPKSATRNMFLDSTGKPIPRLSLEGHLAIGVPGSIDGIFELHEKLGSKPIAVLMEPAIELAEKGYPITKSEADRLNKYRDEFLSVNKRKIPPTEKEFWKEGDTIVYSELGATLRRIQKSGRNEFYKGTTADLLVKEMKKGNGLITYEDLDNFKSKWRTPLIYTYKNYRIITMPPPSSGGIALCQLIHGASKFDLAGMGFHSVESIHILTEIEKRAFADRAKYLGDPDYYKVNTKMLLNKEYLDKKFANIDLSQTSLSTDSIYTKIGIHESYETTHISIVDAYGNAVAITTTLNGNYGSFVMVEQAGFFLNNEMDDFTLKPGVPNQFGLVGSEANAISPGKRMLSSMTPTIIEKDGKLFMVIGATGGPTIITSIFQSFLNVAEYAMPMQEAILSKRFHHQWLPDFIMTDIDSATFEERIGLEQMGHHFKFTNYLGQVSAIHVMNSGALEGAVDFMRSPDETALGF